MGEKKNNLPKLELSKQTIALQCEKFFSKYFKTRLTGVCYTKFSVQGSPFSFKPVADKWISKVNGRLQN